MKRPAPQAPRFAIYTRQSAEPRDGLSSCEAQFQTCMDFATAESGQDAASIGERFDDEGVSGRTLDRPGLYRLRERMHTGDFDVVYVMAMDRLSRTLRDVVMLFDELESAGVAVRLVHQPELSSGPESRLLRHILASFAEFEREMIATRIAETREYLKRHGRRLAGPPPCRPWAVAHRDRPGHRQHGVADEGTYREAIGRDRRWRLVDRSPGGRDASQPGVCRDVFRWRIDPAGVSSGGRGRDAVRRGAAGTGCAANHGYGGSGHTVVSAPR